MSKAEDRRRWLARRLWRGMGGWVSIWWDINKRDQAIIDRWVREGLVLRNDSGMVCPTPDAMRKFNAT